ncbi:MAG TPA: M20/M25/M40 family metallo-hydrolase [Chthoniobacterales bacterium]
MSKSTLYLLALGVLSTLNPAGAFAQSDSPSSSATPARDQTLSTGAVHGSAGPNQAFTAKTLSELNQLQEAALESDYAYRQVAHLANNIGPRLSGSLSAAKAVEYVAAELKNLGCEVTLEKVMVPHWVRGEETAALAQYSGQAEHTTQKIVLCALGGSVATPTEGLTAEVIGVNDFEELKGLPRDKVAGKIVLFNYSFDKQMAAENRGGDAYSEAVVYRSDGPAAAARQGAAACLIRSVGGADYRLPHTGQTNYADGVSKLPAAAITAEDSDLIVNLLKEGPVRMKLVLTPQTLPEAESYNVIGDLKGSEHPEQIVIVSGHLDSWDLGTGAIDDGAGVAVSMETVNLVRKLKLQPKRTIRVVAWINEENGLAGSKRYAADHAGDMSRHFAAMETDGGAGHPLGIHMKVKTEAKEMLAPIAAILQRSGAGILAFTEHAGADIGLLDKAGVPTFAPIQDSRFYFNYHHTAADTLDKIVPKELAENSAVVAVWAYAMASMEQPLPRSDGKP